ncbi:sensor histidine kinase [Edaphocola aurantiacus]|uniref:sensor histidine kinase n=1 Tax=Edaphocola aurantiacus TaxID=2601682 RepID=UPI001C9882FF|nr:HAMP domain-containing sensor histidine kinase [Edaphocola aurantiacus]
MIKQFLTWRSFAILFGLAIVAISFYYINGITKEMEVAEKEKVKTTIEGIKYLNQLENNSDANFATSIVAQNKTIPIIIVSDDGNNIYINLDSNQVQKDSAFVDKKIKEYKALKQYFVSDFGYGRSTIYYGNSAMLERLKYYPLMQIAIITVFISIVIIAIFNAQRSLQNQVWVGMSKETAHQMGTPLSSIVGWLELLKDNEENRESVEEMEKDVLRLKLVADRFSKIGSIPVLEEENLVPRLQNMVDYMQLRAPKKVQITFDSNGAEEACYLLSGPLFDWVIENLIRNALDAMEGAGKIHINMTNTTRQIVIDVCDTGKGMPKTSYKKVFNPGYSTKQRGWGLGLSLAKRIINVYHNGQIFVKNSEIGKGTTFRIILTR